MAELIVPAVVNPVAENSVNTIGRQFGYLWNYRKNMSNLEKQVDELQSKINDLDRSVDSAERNAKEIGDHVKNWASEAKGIIGQANKILEHKEKGKLRCRVGLCPNLVSRHRLGRKASKIVLEVADVITKVPIREVFFRPVGQERTILSTKGLFAFDSRKSIFDEIMKALQTEPMVGLYGFGGMGKTTLAKQVAKRAEEEMLFEEFVFASVTQKVDMKEIQGQLASMLDLELEESTVAERAKRIHQRLKGKKVLVILDDLWDGLYLEEMGVPFGRNGSKILLTSRFGRVLTSMGTGKIFNLGALDEEEAWRLFKDKDGDGVLKNSDFHDIGKEVAKRCQGLPVLIVTVAASLSKRPQLSAWNDALRQLKEMDNKQMHDTVNSAIEFITYNHLEKTHKKLFLLCGVFMGDISIEELFQYSWGFDLFNEESVTIQEARDRLHTLILDLKESCLLLDDVDKRNTIKMHDVVRDAAIYIGRKDYMFSMREDDYVLRTWPKDDDLKKCTAMVLRGCPDSFDLPLYLECPSLELFVMSGTFGNSLSIPESFLEKTSKLKVLGLSKLSFTALPPSLSSLKNLQTLRVDYCDSLKDISVVGGFKKLQTLSLAGSGIEELPSGIGQLSELRSLDVRCCFKLKVIPAGLIQGLTRLEELYVPREFNRWEAEERVNGSVKTNASLRELKHLHNLSSLEVRARDDKFLLEDIHFEKLERYKIIVGDFDNLWLLDRIKVTRKFCVQLSSTSINHLPQGFKRLSERAECLWLEELRGFKNVTPALYGDVSSNLKHLRIKKDYEIEYVVNVDKQCKVVFPCLESLHLDYLVKLQKICNGPLMEGSFCNLTTMGVSNCNGLESLFSFSMATGLPRLQVIEVSNCHALEAIVAEKSIKDDDGVNINDGVPEEVEFAQLRTLTLKRLPKLKNFFSNGEMQNKSHKSQSPNLNTKDEEEELKSILPFFTKVSFPELEKLELSEISNFKYLLTSSVAMGLVKLKSLKVEDCAGMKHLVVAEEEGETNIETLNFPQLRKLSLLKLPNLTAIDSVMGSNDTQPPINKKVLFPKLEELKVSEISNLTEIWSHVFREISCCNLTRLTIKACKSLKHVFPAHVAPSLNKLKYLFIRDCEEVETIICDENYEESLEEIIKAAQHEHAAATFMFFKLNRLVLRRLPKVKCFYPRKHTIKCPVLTSFSMTDCGNLSIFDFLSFPPKEGDDQFEKVVSKLEYLSIRSTQLKKIRDLYGHFPPHLFSSLERLQIVGSDVFPSEFLGIIHKQLKVFRVMGSNDTQPPINKKVLFPKLEELKVSEISNLTEIWSHVFREISCCNLTRLTIKACKSLKHVFPAHVAPSLNKLEYLDIRDCEEVETIIGDENYEESLEEIIKAAQHEHAAATFMFFKLEYLVLRKLPKVKCFYPRKHTIKCPVLTYCNVTDCGNLSIFDFLSFPPKEGDDQFEKVVSKLEDLKIGSTELKMIRDLYGHFPPHLFSSLKRLQIVGSDVFPSEFLGIIHKQLKVFRVMGSNDTQPPINKKVLFPKLEELKVSEISNLTEIWSHVFREISCCNLTRLTIKACKSLKHVFPAHVAPSLNKLEYLDIRDCEEVETIIGDENYEESLEEIIKAAQHEHAAATFMFFKLEYLVLRKLPKVKCFYPRKHTIKCPVLTYCNVTDCGNLSIFDFLSFPPKEGDDQFEKVVSKLEDLKIGSTELKMIRDLYGHFPPHLFSSLKRLQIVGSDVFPSEFLGIIHKQLTKFTVYNCSFQEIFPYEGEFTNHANDYTLFLPQLASLLLYKLPELKYICKHDQKKSLILNILGRLEYIIVRECPLLTNLLQPSTTKCLKKLWDLTISGCEKMENVIGDDDELSRDDDNEIIFPNLRMLALVKLPRLRNFCSSPNYTFNFPKLEFVEVRECPNMKTFCEGITTTPELKKVNCEGGEKRWEGDLNTTIQKVFAETEAKRLGKSLPSTSSSNHVEGNDHVLENSSEEHSEPIPTVVCQNQEKAIVPYTREKGKGKEPDVSEEVMEDLDPSTHSYTAREQIVAGSVASSSKLSSHSEEFHERVIPSTSSSSNNQEAEIHDQTAEPTKEHHICNHVVNEISEEGTFTETRIATEISEDGAEKSAKLEVRELAPLLPSTSSTNYTEATNQVLENSAKAHNDATNADKMADTLEKGFLPSSEETNPPAGLRLSLSLPTELEVPRSTPTVESEATNPRKAGETWNHSEIEIPEVQRLRSTVPITSSSNDIEAEAQVHVNLTEKVTDVPLSDFVQVADAYDKGKGNKYVVFEETVESRNETSHCLETEPKTSTASSSSHQESFRGLRESFQLLEAQPMSRVSAEQVRFMEEAGKWFSGYVQQAREYLEQKELISEFELKIDDMEAQLQALKEKKRVAEEKKKVASRVAKFG